MSGRKKTGGRKKSVSRQKAGGKRSAMTREEEALWRAGGVLTDGSRTPRERSEVIKAQALSVAKELSELGNDPEWYEDVKTDIQTGRWIEASLSIQGYAESFMDPIMKEKGDAMAKKIGDHVGQNKSYSSLEVGWGTDNLAHRIAMNIEKSVGDIKHLKVPSFAYRLEQNNRVEGVLGQVAMRRGLHKQRLARVAAHLEDQNLHNEADYIREVLVGGMSQHDYVGRIKEEWFK